MATDTGAVIAGRYHLQGQIGRGGMAVVHRAEDERLGRDVAVKVLDRSAHPDGRGEDRFAREAQRAAGLNHPNIVQVHDTGIDGEHPFIVMEYVDGPTLADRIDERGPLPADEAIRIAGSICDALEAAHEAGIIHRDVKPSNVLFDPKGRVKLADFGLAKAHAGDTITQGNPMGSAAYVSPEQISDAPVDHRADLFSLGVVLYEMVTGRRPFKGDTAAATAVQRLEIDPSPPSELADLPAGLERIILRLLERDPDARFETASDVAAALAQVGGDTATLPVIIDGEPDGRSRSTRWLLVALALLAAALVGVALWPSSDGEEVTTPDVSQMTVEAATRILEDAGLEVGDVQRRESEEPDGLVLSQAPDPGVTVAAGSAVDLVVSGEPTTTDESSPSPSPSPTETTTDTGDQTGGSTDGGGGDGGGGDGNGGGPPGGTPPGQDGDPPGRGNG
ncbi:MAG: protein kinase [Nitriliruptorales bacterium]|nr:protein kinase [Nitriliruptorales bacterium]